MPTILLALGLVAGLRAQQVEDPPAAVPTPQEEHLLLEPEEDLFLEEGEELDTDFEAELGLAALSGESEEEALQSMSLADLLEIQVQVASRQVEDASATPAALAVIGGERIARFGFGSVPEALRSLPGMHVARTRNEVWSVATRGFNQEFGDKVSVFVDGRSRVNPYTGGVYWDFTEPFLPDVEQIEVIRGPGATLWGANAVNGVISIRSKHTRDTLGGYLEIGSGTEQLGRVRLRYGEALADESGFWRVWVQGLLADGGRLADRSHAHDDARRLRAGFRIDLEVSERDELEFQGEIGRLRQESLNAFPVASPPFLEIGEELRDSFNAMLSARWKRVNADNEWSASLHLERQGIEDYGDLDQEYSVFDLQVEHFRQTGERTDVVAGLQYRIEESFPRSPGRFFAFDDEAIANHTLSGFAQLRWSLWDEGPRLVVGTKVEHNAFSGFEVQPSVRLATGEAGGWMAWAAASRSVRTPTMIYRHSRAVVRRAAVPGIGPITVAFEGREVDQSEIALTYELGARGPLSDSLFADLSFFVADYSDVVSFEELAPRFDPASGGLLVPSTIGNNAEATTLGGEIVLTWAATEELRIDGSYSLTLIDDSQPRGAMDIVGLENVIEDDFPTHLATLNAVWSPHEEWDLTMAASFADVVPDRAVPSKVRLDLSARWRPNEQWSLAFGGRDLLRKRTVEYAPDLFAVPIYHERNFWISATYRF